MAKPEKPLAVSAVEGYDPRLLKLWRDGAKAHTKMDCPEGKGQATNMRARMYRLRLAMYREYHPDSTLVKKAKIAIGPNPDGTWYITVYPVTSEFDSVFKSAGGTEEDAGAPPLDD